MPAGFPWLVLLALGAGHGANPAMGWLFAVSLGMQERSVRAVWRALVPLAFGHAFAVLAALGVLYGIGAVVPLTVMQWIVAAILTGLAVRRMTGTRHPSFGRMRIGARDLSVWSFLMASAHGAGLMVAPFVIGTTAVSHGHSGALPAAAATMGTTGGMEAVALHTLGYIAVTGLIAVPVFARFGLGALRRAWINVDWLWTGLLLVTGLLTPFL